jgi:type IV pilus assembly protein PilY1
VYSDGGDFGYGGAEVRPSEVAYAAFVEAKAGIPPIIYAGANDGMLHAFCAANPNDPESSCPAGIEPGEELFAYIPQAVYGNLSALTDPLYAHRYYVDGQISVADAYLGGAWGTYLVGALGAGGKGIYALDVSDPVNFAAADVKWEFTDADNLGLTFGKPQIARIAIDNWGERWGVIFGNGYNSTSDRAYLFVVDLADGTPVAEIAAGNEAANGLSTPYLHDSNGDTVVDAVYAGDLRGNLWKFVNTGGTWSLGNGGQPLFTARSAQNEIQPITAQPVVSAHPNGGVLVYFGTGSYLTACDIGDPVNCTGTYDDQQAFYAIWDNGEVGTVARAKLERYSILTETPAFGYQVRTTSEGTINWQEDRGWYLDLPRTPNSPAERIVSPAIVLEFTAASVPDRILFVTNTPSSDPCTMGGTSWLMELALVTGGRPASPIFDLDKSGSFDSNDKVGDAAPSGVAINSAYGITGEPLILTTEGGNIYKAFSGTTGKSGIIDASPMQQGEPPPGAPIRVYWRQIQ